MTRILSQEEVDALLRGISGGEIETETETVDVRDPADIMPYDLTSQDRIIRGRMPTLDMTNEKFSRAFRTTLSSLLRKVTSVSAISVDMIKFGEFLKTLPVPTSLHLFRLDPLRGSGLIVFEAKIIFMLVDILFGGTGKDTFKVEGREFTAIENNVIRRVVINALTDMEKAWKSLIEVKMTYQRSEMNPQFVYIASPTDVVIVINFEIEVESSSGMMTLCLPYAALEPIKDKLQAGFQSEQMEADQSLVERFKKNILRSNVEIIVELGTTQISSRDLVHLQRGDVIQLDGSVASEVSIMVEGIKKFMGRPAIYRGNQAVQISEIFSGKED
ncbi:MAG: flagellar motor switch protein FliM [Syntrophus sp. (in: bacteria)]